MTKQGNIFKRSVALRIVSLLSIVIFFGLSALTSIQLLNFKSALENDFEEASEIKSELLATQMYGGIKWKKADNIHDAYDMLMLDDKSNFASVYVYSADGAVINEEHSEFYDQFDFKAFLQEHPDLINSQEEVIVRTPNYFVVSVPSINKKKGKKIGGSVIAWSLRSQQIALTQALTLQLIISVVIVLLLIAIMGWLLGSVIIKPIKSGIEIMTTLATGDYNIDVPNIERLDEIGTMSRAIEVFKKNAIDKENAEKVAQEAEERMKGQRKLEMQQVASQFEERVMGLVDHLLLSIGTMEQTFDQLSNLAQETEKKSGDVAGFSESASTNVGTVAAASEELDASVREVIIQVTKAADLTGKANTQAKETSSIVVTLQDSAAKIGEVVLLIQNIAEQTNLLALNATIEAARAGEAGKGFAVVANEVKSLASETAKATEEIAERVQEIQAISNQSSTAISEIAHSIVDVNERIVAVSSASEEQGDATREISKGAQEAAAGTGKVSVSIAEVNQTAIETEKLAHETRAVLADISEKSTTLKAAVNAFIEDISE